LLIILLVGNTFYYIGHLKTFNYLVYCSFKLPEMSDSVLSKEDLLELGYDGDSLADLVANAENKALADEV